jgi:hypothetical protein
MLLKVDLSKELFRLAYNQLYSRVLKFALEHGDTEDVVKARFTALVAGDPSVTLLVNIEEAQVTAHCLFLLGQVASGDFNIFVDQLQVDSKHNEAFVKDCISFGENIPGVSRISMFTDEKKYKAFGKKYDFHVSKIFMYRDVKRD